MPRKKGSTQAETEARLNQIEAMQASCVPNYAIAVALAERHGISRRQARNLIRRVDERRAAERLDDAPYMRERLRAKAEKLTAKCIADGKHAAAVQSLALEARLTGALQHRDPEVDALVLENGPPPRDPALAHVWLQRNTMITLWAIKRNPAIDPLMKLRLEADFSAKATLMGDKAMVQEDLRLLKEADRADRARESDAAVDPPAVGAAQAGEAEPGEVD